jgi:branched-chain amino acid transport system substrate-binding protein
MSGRLALAVTAAAVLTAACGSSGSSTSSDASTPATTSPVTPATTPTGPNDTTNSATTTAASVAAIEPAVAAPQGEPVKLGVIYTDGVPGYDTTGARPGAEAAAATVNAQGGIGGRPLEVVVCNDSGDAIKAQQCAQQFVSEQVIAVVGVSNQWGDNGLSVIEQAGIANVTLPISLAEFVNPVSFPVTGGTAAQFPALASYLATDGATTVASIYVDIAAGAVAAQTLLQAPLEQRDVTVTLVPEQAGASDPTISAAKVLGTDPDAVVLIQNGFDCERSVGALLSIGVTAPIFVPNLCAQVAFDNPDVEIGVLSDLLPPDSTDNADVAVYAEAMGSADAARDLLAQESFAAVMTLKAVIGESEPTAASVLAALASPSGVPVFMGAMLNSPGSAAALAPNLHNTTARIMSVKDGRFVDLSTEFVDGWVS